MDTSSDAPFSPFSPFQRVHKDEPEDATMVCDTALPAPDVEMVLEDPVSALVSLVTGLSLWASLLTCIWKRTSTWTRS